MPQGRHDGDVRSYELEGKDGLPNAPIVFDLTNVVTKYGREVSDRLRVAAEEPGLPEAQRGRSAWIDVQARAVAAAAYGTLILLSKADQKKWPAGAGAQ